MEGLDARTWFSNCTLLRTGSMAVITVGKLIMIKYTTRKHHSINTWHSLEPWADWAWLPLLKGLRAIRGNGHNRSHWCKISLKVKNVSHFLLLASSTWTSSIKIDSCSATHTLSVSGILCSKLPLPNGLTVVTTHEDVQLNSFRRGDRQVER